MWCKLKPSSDNRQKGRWMQWEDFDGVNFMDLKLFPAFISLHSQVQRSPRDKRHDGDKSSFPVKIVKMEMTDVW